MSISTTYKKSDLIWSILTEEIGFYGWASSKASTNSIVPIVALFNNVREPSSPPGLSSSFSSSWMLNKIIHADQVHHLWVRKTTPLLAGNLNLALFFFRYFPKVGPSGTVASHKHFSSLPTPMIVCGVGRAFGCVCVCLSVCSVEKKPLEVLTSNLTSC